MKERFICFVFGLFVVTIPFVFLLLTNLFLQETCGVGLLDILKGVF